MYNLSEFALWLCLDSLPFGGVKTSYDVDKLNTNLEYIERIKNTNNEICCDIKEEKYGRIIK